jgi:hypothetical protein
MKGIGNGGPIPCDFFKDATCITIVFLKKGGSVWLKIW